ncbi:hypothetical protein [Streptomyces clavifer]|uniref:hypothetical protein n=1 Tax=Streptomyces clavifer TaxID=68188 RepID=UPI0006FA5111|nr:hypothetical protein ASD26_25550 [Streptomyces sp. Root1319]KQZ03497.1 hypothetical protein ASD51_20630 [Streptomyces sp. Root55]
MDARADLVHLPVVRRGKRISGATKASLTLRTARKGKKITVRVTAKRTGHGNGSAVSKPTRVVVGRPRGPRRQRW